MAKPQHCGFTQLSESEWHHITWMITNNSLAGSQLKEDNNVITLPLWQTVLSYNRITTCSFDTKPVSHGFVGNRPVNQKSATFLTSHLESGCARQAGRVK